MKSFDKASTNVSEVRSAFGKRIGEIITAVIGDETLQNIFESPEHNEAYLKANAEGTPSGFIAMDLGIVDKETKNALLVAQAAERMAQNAERAYAVNNGTEHEDGWVIDIHDDVFQYVGSDRDPENLQEAQASWQISQIWLNEKVREATRDPNDTGYPNQVYTIEGGEDFSGGLLKAAANYYAEAGKTLAEKGFDEAAEKMRIVSDAIMPENADAIKATPNDVACAFLSGEQRYRQDMYIALSSDHYTGGEGDNANETLGKKLIGLTEGQRKDDSGQDHTAKVAP